MPERFQLEERTFFVPANGHILQVSTLYHAGTKDAGEPTLVFLHEGLGCIDTWRNFPRQLCEATGLGALIYDRYGFGGSDPLLEPRSAGYLEQEAHQSLPELLEACGITTPLLIGHSDGGTIALLYAARFPERPRGVITEAAHVFVEEVTLSGIRQAEAAYQAGGLRDKLMRHHGQRTDAMFHGWSDIWLAPEFRDWSVESELARIRCPVLAIQGEDDEYGSAAQVQAIASRVSGPAAVALIPGCGHIPHHQARERVLREMTEFIGTIY
jgi:pimeloyl-ACP methyl ester carboxylesterase